MGLYVGTDNVGCEGGSRAAGSLTSGGHVKDAPGHLDRPGLAGPPGVWQEQGKCVENNQAKPLIPAGEQQRFSCCSRGTVPPALVCIVRASSSEHMRINYRIYSICLVCLGHRSFHSDTRIQLVRDHYNYLNFNQYLIY